MVQMDLVVSHEDYTNIWSGYLSLKAIKVRETESVHMYKKKEISCTP